MTDNATWAWNQTDAARFEDLNATEAWIVHVNGEEAMLVVHAIPDPDDIEIELGEPSVWQVWTINTLERDGFAGLEQLDSYPSRDAAIASVERDKDALTAALSA